MLQCVEISARCDNFKQCLDGRDEHRCPSVQLGSRLSEKLPVIVDFLRKGGVAIRSLRHHSGSVDKACPETHFWCPSKDFCLPVFVRCNDVYDCPGHEDEEGCDVYTCPGFYRCRASKVCVHIAHVCDDWPLCPQHDDELLCDRQCPLQCICHGLAFFCNRAFVAHKFPDLRYLDVRGTAMNTHHLNNNQMLIHLSIAKCNVTTVGNTTFHNLHSLDLSDNLLKEVSVHHLVLMPQLTVLFLAGNPLIFVFTDLNGSSLKLPKVNLLDLSRVQMHSVDLNLVMTFPNLHTLNLSHCGVQQLKWNSTLIPVTCLRQLDLRGCVIEDSLGGFLHLQLLFTDNFKLCCPSVLPPGFDLHRCHVIPDGVSSCDNLLGSTAYRAALAVLAALAVTGNVASLILRVFAGRTWRLSSGGMALTQLSVADLGTGLHLVILGLADHILVGPYVWQDIWRKGTVCYLAGVLALCCRHAATFFVTILTLNCCLHRCPTLSLRLTPAKVKVMCVVVWASSILLAAVPLIPQWQFFREQSLCVPLPLMRNHSTESHFANVVLVLLHFLLFAFCSVAEVISGILCRVMTSSIMNKDRFHRRFQYVVLGSLTTGFIYTITCMVATDSHTPGQKAIHTALVYFGSVVGCAMNPFLYLYGVRMEHSEKIKDERLRMIVNRARL